VRQALLRLGVVDLRVPAAAQLLDRADVHHPVVQVPVSSGMSLVRNSRSVAIECRPAARSAGRARTGGRTPARSVGLGHRHRDARTASVSRSARACRAPGPPCGQLRLVSVDHHVDPFTSTRSSLSVTRRRSRSAHRSRCPGRSSRSQSTPSGLHPCQPRLARLPDHWAAHSPGLQRPRRPGVEAIVADKAASGVRRSRSRPAMRQPGAALELGAVFLDGSGRLLGTGAHPLPC